MPQPGDRLREVETRESASMIETSGDPSSGAGTAAAPGLLAIDPTAGVMYYNKDGDPTNWAAFGTGGSGEVNTGTNLGTGAGVYAGKSATVLQFRSLIGTAPIVATENANDITFDLDITNLTTISTPTTGDELIIERGGTQYKIDFTDFATGSLDSVSNVGTGAGVYKQVVSGDVELRSLIGTGAVVATQNASDITFSLDVSSLTTITSPTTADYLIIERAGTEYKIDYTTFGGSGEANTGANVGTGAGVYKGMSGTVLQFRSLIGTDPITVTENTDDITIDIDPSSLTTHPSPTAGDWFLLQDSLGTNYKLDYSSVFNTGSQLGTGSDVFKQVTGVDFEFRSLIATLPITATENANDITFDIDIASLTTITSPTTADYLIIERAGASYKIDFTTFPQGDITGAANVGGYTGVYRDEVSGTLNFKTITTDDPLTVTAPGDVITFGIDVSSLTTIASPSLGDYLIIEDALGDLYKIDFTTFDAGYLTGATNVGTGADVYQQELLATLYFRSLIGTNPITATQNTDDITFSLDIAGLTTITSPTTGDYLIIERTGTQYKIDFVTFTAGFIDTVTNVGTGAGVYKQELAGQVDLRSIIGTAPIVATENTNDITLSFSLTSLTESTPSSGDYLLYQSSATLYKTDWDNIVHSGSNLGTGSDVFKLISAGDIQFRTLIGADPLTLTENANDITFSLDVAGLTTITSPTTGDYLIIERTGTEYKIDYTTFAGAYLTSVSNVGTGSGVYKQVVSGDVELRSLIGTLPITTAENASDITFDLDIASLTTISSPGAGDLLIIEDSLGGRYKIDFTTFPQGDITGASNLGAGTGVYYSETSGTLNFRSLVEGDAISITSDTTEITLTIDIASLSDAPTPGVGDYFLVEDAAQGLVRLAGDRIFDTFISGATNTGAGYQTYKEEVSGSLVFRTFNGAAPITASYVSDVITFDLDIASLTTITSPTTGDYLIIERTGTEYKIDFATFTAGFISSVTNVGTGAGVYKQELGGQVDLRSIIGTAPIVATENTSDITLSFSLTSVSESTPSSGDYLLYQSSATLYKTDWDNIVHSGSNLGTGSDVFKIISAGDIQFRTLIGTNPIVATENTSDITFTLDISPLTDIGTAVAGDVLVIENIAGDIRKIDWATFVSGGTQLGTGTDVYKAKVGAALTFRSLLEDSGNPVTLTENTDDITVGFSIAGVATAPASPSSTDLLIVEKSSDGSQYKLPLASFGGTEQTIDKTTWLSSYERETFTAPSDQYYDVLSNFNGAIPSTAVAIICRMAWTTEASSGWFAIGPRTDEFEMVLWQGRDHDCMGVVELNSGTIRIQSNGSSWTVVLDVYGYIEAPTLTGPMSLPHGGQWARTTDTALTNGQFYEIVWETENRDNDGFWSSGADITIQIPGVYIVRLEVEYDTTSYSGYPIQAIIEHESSYVASVKQVSYNGTTRIECTAVLNCAASDVINGVARQSCGTSIDLTDALLSIERVGGAIVAQDLTGYGGRWNRTSTQSIPSATPTEITWQNEERDSNGYWSSGTDITITVAGKYLIAVEAAFDSSTAGDICQAIIYVNDTYMNSMRIATADAVTRLQVVTVDDLSVNDIVTVSVIQDSGSAMDLKDCVISIDRMSS